MVCDSAEPGSVQPLILASQSPRRRQLLEAAGFQFTVSEPHPLAEAAGEAAGGRRDDESPTELVARLAYWKARDVALRTASGVVLGCDTVAECGGEILGKPLDRADAGRMLRHLRGREHHVYSGVCLWQRPQDQRIERVATTRLIMERISESAIEEYLDSGAWQGKAGGFGLQDRLGWIQVVEGSDSNVVGLPMELVAQLLAELGILPVG